MASSIKLKNDLNTEMVITHKDGLPTRQMNGSDIVIAVDTIDDMKALANPYDGMPVFVRDMDRGGNFVYASSKIAEDNDGTNFIGYVRQYIGTVNVKWFGAKGDGVTDDTISIQNAIGACLRFWHKKIYIPDGIYITSDTLQLGYTAYSGIDLIGAGQAYKGERSFSGTIIKSIKKDRPAIAAQAARLSSISNMTIIGGLFEYIDSNNLGDKTCQIDDTSIDIWIDDGFTYGEFNPHCGIAIDPYSGDRQDESYPDVNYPSWTGVTEQYNKAGSSQIRLHNVSIYGFVVGVASQPCGYDANGDFTTFDTVTISHCAYGYSIGNSQARQSLFKNSLINRCHTAITNTSHGMKRGKLPTTLLNTNFDMVIDLINVNAAYGDMKFDGCYAEQLYKIGYGLSSYYNSPILLTNCEFNFSSINAGKRGVPKFIFEGSKNTLMFDGGVLKLPNIPFSCDSDSAIYTNRTVIQNGFTSYTTPEAISNNFIQGGVLYTKTGNINNKFINVDIDNTSTKREDFLLSNIPMLKNLGRSVNFPKVLKTNANQHKNFSFDESFSYINTSTWDDITITDNEVSVNIHESDIGRARYRVDLGDIIFHNNTYYYVKDRTDTTVIFKALTNYQQDLTLNEPITAANDALYWHSRKYTLDGGYEFIFSFEKDSDTANVTRVDGYTGNLEDVFTVGDRLIITDDLYRVFAISDNQKITAVSNDDSTVTFEHNARRSVSDVLVFMMSRTFNS